MKHIVSAEWLDKNLNNPNVRVIHCNGFDNYLKEHIPGAFYFDLEEDLSGAVEEHGGRHPLPSIEELTEKLSTAGIDREITVVVYDDEDGMVASRLWWMLHYLGHVKTYVLDGGFYRWKSLHYEVNPEIPSPQRRQFKPIIQHDLAATMVEVKQSIGRDEVVLIDSRAKERYDGIHEPIDHAAGHIPSARNYFWKNALTIDGNWKSLEELTNQFEAIDKKATIVVYCGSGVTACPNVLAFKEAGYENVKLYVGSWSDWISYPENKIEKS